MRATFVLYRRLEAWASRRNLISAGSIWAILAAGIILLRERVVCQKSADPKHAQFWGSRRLALSSLWACLSHPD